MRLKSLASYHNKSDFGGITVWVAKPDTILEGEIIKVMPKTCRIAINKKEYLFKHKDIYLSLDDAEVRFTRDAIKKLSDQYINWSKLLDRLANIKERKPHLFL